MDFIKTRQPRRLGFKQPLDRRVDQLIESGLQFVDGIAGTRPGIRKPNLTNLSVPSLDKVGRWVGDKLDWFLEDEDDWVEPWQSDEQVSSSGKKKPLEAISRRTSNKQPTSASLEASKQSSDPNEWPDASSFRVERWQRRPIKENDDSLRLQGSRRESRGFERRALPRSSRRR